MDLESYLACEAVAILPVPAGRAAGDGDSLADRELERRIRNFLYGRNVPSLRGLWVRVDQGTATVRGRVATFYEKQLAAACCQRVAGVVRIIDEVDAPE